MADEYQIEIPAERLDDFLDVLETAIQRMHPHAIDTRAEGIRYHDLSRDKANNTPHSAETLAAMAAERFEDADRLDRKVQMTVALMRQLKERRDNGG